MVGVTLAGLAEGMALADRAGLQQKDVMEVLELTGLACPTLLGRGKAIIDGGFPTHQVRSQKQLGHHGSQCSIAAIATHAKGFEAYQC